MPTPSEIPVPEDQPGRAGLHRAISASASARRPENIQIPTGPNRRKVVVGAILFALGAATSETVRYLLTGQRKDQEGKAPAEQGQVTPEEAMKYLEAEFATIDQIIAVTRNPKEIQQANIVAYTYRLALSDIALTRGLIVERPDRQNVPMFHRMQQEDMHARSMVHPLRNPNVPNAIIERLLAQAEARVQSTNAAMHRLLGQPNRIVPERQP